MIKTIRKISLILIALTLVILAGFAPTDTTRALEPENMAFDIGYKRVDRVAILERFFAEFNSPLESNAKTFVRVADEYNIDFALLPAIACQESTCGKFVIADSHNPFGWGIYGNQHIAFDSYEQAIEEVGAGLHAGYFSKGYDTLAEIAPIYTPPSNGSWYRGVTWFESQIGDIALAI